MKEYVHVDINADWRQKQSDNQGLGMLYNYITNLGYQDLGKGTEYDTKWYSFTQATTNDIMHIDYIAQGTEANSAWTTFILDDSNGFTRAGVERINDASEHTAGLFLVHSLKQGLTYWELALHLMHKNSFLPTLKMQ